MKLKFAVLSLILLAGCRQPPPAPLAPYHYDDEPPVIIPFTDEHRYYNDSYRVVPYYYDDYDYDDYYYDDYDDGYNPAVEPPPRHRKHKRWRRRR